jgi:hypothetical protein
VNSTLREYNTTQGYMPTGDGPSRTRQVCQQGRDLGTKLNRAAPSARSPPVIAKPTYIMFMIAWKLRHYFPVHPVIVVNEAPLSNILNNLEAMGRVSLWGIEISP